MKTPGIYKITNLKTGKFYIGSSVDIPRRWKEHKRDLRGKYHYNSKLQNSWSKHGESAFLFEVMEYAPVEQLIDIEQYYIDALKPFLNVNPIAGSCLGRKFSDKSKKKMSLSAKNRPLPKALIAQQQSKNVPDKNGYRVCKNCCRSLLVQTNFNKKARRCYKCKYKEEEADRKIARKLARRKNQKYIIGIGDTICFKFLGVNDAEVNLRKTISKFNRHGLRSAIRNNKMYHNLIWKEI